MANVLCKMCGGTVEVPEEVEDGSYGECPYCGTMMTFALRGGTLSVDFPACQTENDAPQLGGTTPGNDGGGRFGDIAMELLKTGKYDELLSRSETMLKEAGLKNEPANPLVIALKATAICLLEADGDTEEIRIAEVASLFTAAFDGLASLDEAAAINRLDDAGVSKARNIISNLAMDSFPLLASATMRNRLDYVMVSDSDLLADRVAEVCHAKNGPDVVLLQIGDAIESFSRYPDLEGISPALADKLNPLILEKIDERAIASLSQLEVEHKGHYLVLIKHIINLEFALCKVLIGARDVGEHVIAEERIKLLADFFLKTTQNTGYDYVPDEFGAYKRVPWTNDDLIANLHEQHRQIMSLV